MSMRTTRSGWLYISVRGGGQYLTARRRIVWMRGEIVPHPDWTIDTYAEEIERGKYTSNYKVEGGYARYRANVFDVDGRLVGTGTKTEWSERFMDFAEKAECVPLDTEILTREGWKTYDQLTIGEEVLAYDQLHDLTAWTPLQRVVTYDDVPIVRLANKHAFEAWCTPDHTWPVASTNPKKSDALIKTNALKSQGFIPLSAPVMLFQPINVSPEQAALMGYAITDGAFRWTGNSVRLTLYQSKQDIVQKMRALLSAFHVHETVRAAGSRTFPGGKTYNTLPAHRFHLKATDTRGLLGTFGIKHESELPRVVGGLGPMARQAMLEAMMDADGDSRGNFSKKRRPWVMDVFQILATLQGVALTPVRMRKNAQPVQRLRKSRHVDVGHLEVTDAGTADVWCPTTEYGTWVARFSNGLVTITGNTGAIARALAVCGYGTEAALDLDEGIEQDRIADAPVTDVRPISITSSNVSGLVQGGRSENITQAQLNEIQRLIGQAAMGMTLVPFMEGVLETSVPELGDDPTGTILAFIKSLSFSEAAALIRALADKRSRRPIARRRSLSGPTRSAQNSRGRVGIGNNGSSGVRGERR